MSTLLHDRPVPPRAVLPAEAVQLTVTIVRCPHQATSRYGPAEPPGHDLTADALAEALRCGWAVPDEPGLAREAWLVARDIGGRPAGEWVVTNLHGLHWLRKRLGLFATHVGCRACDPMRGGRAER